jgi:O-antigen/teichoic acid export membrane protein
LARPNLPFLKLVGQGSAVSVAGSSLTLILSIMLARSLGPEGLGIYSYVIAIVGFAVLIAQFGFPHLTVREVAKLEEKGRFRLLGRYLRYTTLVIAGMSVLLATILFWAAPILMTGDPSNRWTLVAALPLIALLALTAQAASVLRGKGLITQSLVGQAIYRPGLFALFLATALVAGVSLTATSAVLLYGLASLLVLIEIWMRLSGRLGHAGRPLRVPAARLKSWMVSGLMLSGATVAYVINTKFDIIAIGLLMTKADVGLYAVGVQVSQAGVAMLLVTANIIMPAISRLSTAGKDAEIEALCRQSAMLSGFVAFVALLILLVIGDWVIALAYGQEFVAAWTVLIVLISGQLGKSLLGPADAVLVMRGKEKITMVVAFFASAANIALNFALIPHFGLLGAASATALTTAGWNFVLWLFVLRIWGINTSAISFSISKKYDI